MNRLKFVLLTSLFFISSLKDIYAAPVTVNLQANIQFRNFNSPSKELNKELIATKNIICKRAKEEILSWSMSTLPEAPCTDIDQNQTESSQVGTTVRFTYNKTKNKITMSIINNKPEDSVDPTLLSWDIENNTEGLITINKLLHHYYEFDSNKQVLKKQILENGLEEKIDNYDFARKYNDFIVENPKNRRYMAAALEIAAILGASTLSYYAVPADKNSNKVDWDYMNFSDSMKARFTGDLRGNRFDDNAFRTNRGHYYAGVVYYTAARNSGLNKLDSLLLTFAASSCWEYFSENREVASINDQINTSLGGFIIGESIHQISKIFKKGPNTGVNLILKEVFGSPEKMSAKLENKIKGENVAYDFDLSEEQMDFWSKLDLYAQIQKMGPNQVKLLGFDAEVVNIPMFDEPGKVSKVLTDTVFSQLLIEAGSSAELATFKMFTKTTLAAYYQKNMGLNKKEQLEGYQMYIGPSVGLDIDEKTYNNDRRDHDSDFRGVVHVLGGTLDMTAYHNGFTFHVVMDVYGDFAMMKSWAFDRATNDTYRNSPYNANDPSGIQSVLRSEGYYYGAGTTGDLKITLAKDKFSAGASYQNTHTSMINARSRYSENEQTDVHASDSVETIHGWVAYQLTKSLQVEAGITKTERKGSALGESFEASDVVKYGRLIYKY